MEKFYIIKEDTYLTDTKIEEERRKITSIVIKEFEHCIQHIDMDEVNNLIEYKLGNWMKDNERIRHKVMKISSSDKEELFLKEKIIESNKNFVKWVENDVEEDNE